MRNLAPQVRHLNSNQILGYVTGQNYIVIIYSFISDLLEQKYSLCYVGMVTR